MIRFEATIPISDANSNDVDTSSLNAAMETIAIDGQTHLIGQDTVRKAGNFEGQASVLCWFIQDTAVSQATTNFTNFISGFTFSLAPYTHNWAIN